MKGGMQRRSGREKEKEKEGTHGMVQLPRLWTVYEAQQGLWTCSCRSVNKWKHMVMSPPSGRLQNFWMRDKLRQCNRQNNSMIFYIYFLKRWRVIETGAIMQTWYYVGRAIQSSLHSPWRQS